MAYCLSFRLIYDTGQSNYQERYEIKSYVELKAEVEAIQEQRVEAWKNKAIALQEAKRPCKEFGFSSGILCRAMYEGDEKQ